MTGMQVIATSKRAAIKPNRFGPSVCVPAGGPDPRGDVTKDHPPLPFHPLCFLFPPPLSLFFDPRAAIASTQAGKRGGTMDAITRTDALVASSSSSSSSFNASALGESLCLTSCSDLLDQLIARPGWNEIAWTTQIFLTGCTLPLFLSLFSTSLSNPPPSTPSRPTSPAPFAPASQSSSTFATASSKFKVLAWTVFLTNFVAAGASWFQIGYCSSYFGFGGEGVAGGREVDALETGPAEVVFKLALLPVALVTALVQMFYTVRCLDSLVHLKGVDLGVFSAASFSG